MIFLSLLLSSLLLAEITEPEYLKWKNLDVVWIQEERFPTFDIKIYFEEGGIGDPKGVEGITNTMFDALTLGTTRYSQKEINDALEYYGISFGARVVHEYSVYSVAGLNKDFVPTMKMICHLFKNASFNKNELSKYKNRKSASIRNLVNSHSQLADRVFRQVNLMGTPYERPTSGTLESLKKINTQNLISRLNHFNKEVKKRVYVTSSINKNIVKGILLKDCGWGEENNASLNFSHSTRKEKKGRTYFVPVQNANQAQIRLGRYLEKNELKNWELMDLASNYLGGGFSSVLIQELRVKRGLTYSAMALGAAQRNYGRTIIATFTKNSTLLEALKVIKEQLAKTQSSIDKNDLIKNKGHLIGSYLFGLEKNSAYSSKLLFFDHIGKSFQEMIKYPKKIETLNEEDLKKMLKHLFNFEKLDVLILGNPKLSEKLPKDVIKLDYKNFL